LTSFAAPLIRKHNIGIAEAACHPFVYEPKFHDP
jgi:hypothetical protein